MMNGDTENEYSVNIWALMSDEQQQAFEKLKVSLISCLPPGTDDLKILKFLVARDFDVDKAADMMKRHLVYWDKMRIGRSVEKFIIPQKSQYFPTSVLGFDNDGSIVRLLRVGVSDLRGLSMSHSKSDATLFAAYMLESDKRKQKERFKLTGEGGTDRQTYIFDLLELRWRTLFFRPLAQKFAFMMRLYESNYPESLKTAYIVNAPSFFNLIYNFVKNILPAEILTKVQILSSEECQSVLTNAMSPDILPKFLGGTRTDPDRNPFCNSLFKYPPETLVPEKYYLRQSLERDPEVKKATVPAQNAFSVKIEVSSVPNLLIWDFQTVNNDIAMGLMIHTEETEPRYILIPKRFDSHKYVESGRYLCNETGTYEIVFDNSYSWWSTKELMYKIVLIQSEDPSAFSDTL